LEAQDYPNLKIHISDDASEDDTFSLCRTFADRSDKIHLVRQEIRLGWIDNINALLNSAVADYLFIIPHDDIVYPSYVSRLVAVLEANPNAILAFADTKIVFCDNHLASRPHLIAEYKELDNITELMERAKRAARYQLDLLDSRWPNILTVAFRGIFRSSAIKRIGGLRRNVTGEFGADWAWLFQLALLGEFVRVPQTLVEKRKVVSSLSKSWNYTLMQRFGEWFGCMAGVRGLRLSPLESWKIQWKLVEAACLIVPQYLRRRYCSLNDRFRRFLEHLN
jgi:GT2 family glycosyltransferase